MSHFFSDKSNKKIVSKRGMTLFISCFIGIMISFFLGGVLAFAQIPNIEQNLSLTITPKIPEPNDGVSISVESFVTDLNRAEITWVVNGVTQKRGIGLKEITITVAPLGEKTIVSLIINTEEGVRIEKNVTFQPALVDIVLEANTYTPPFYRGRALFTAESSITLTALPQFVTTDGAVLDPQELIYTWRRDGRTLSDISGFGRQSINIVGPTRFQDVRISVEVSSFGKSLIAKKTFFLSPKSPEVLFYEKHPLRGILYKKALAGTFILTDQEVVVRAEPYFFSLEDLRSNLTFEWSLNDIALQNEDSQQEIILRQVRGGGFSRLKLDIINVDKLFQDAFQSLTLQFGL